MEWSEVDIRDYDRLHALAEGLPPIDVAINSAGIAIRKPATAISQEEWDRVVDVNLNGAFYFSHALHDRLQDASGVLIHIASVTGHQTLRDRVAYSATKAAVISLARTLAVEWAEDGVRVLSISPTFVDTPLIRRGVSAGEIDLSPILRQTPQGRLLDAEEVASAAFCLASSEFRSVTGADILLDGGFVAYGGF
jgi:NAD(P)-dependent dehydrogenase (short-subunit alcohol dehydrogenase family)